MRFSVTLRLQNALFREVRMQSALFREGVCTECAFS